MDTRILLGAALLALTAVYGGWSLRSEEGSWAAPRHRRRDRGGGVYIWALYALLLLPPLVLGAVSPQGRLRGAILELLALACLYCGALLLLRPLLRRCFKPKLCAALWAVPAFMWLPLAVRSVMPTPRWVLRVPDWPLWPFAALWLLGAAAVMVKQIRDHRAFYRASLAQTAPVTDPAVLALWQQELSLAGLWEKLPLVTGPEVRTPMVVGWRMIRRRALLPSREYTRRELTLIFRHELTHLRRGDIDAKVLIAVLRALCWFNPLVWWGTRSVSGDLEQACDEEALAGADGETRTVYGELLLRTAASETGFSTCLSAGARSLKGRLEAVLKPRRRLTGLLLPAALLLGLFLCVGRTAVATQWGTAAELALSPVAGARVKEVLTCRQYAQWDGRSTWTMFEDRDPAAGEVIMDYLRPLEVTLVYEGNDFQGVTGRVLELDLSTPEKEDFGFLQLNGDWLTVCRHGEGRGFYWGRVYHVTDGLDWAYLESLVE